ncbi:unnamed protein product [Caenorhabditis nigoni]
MFQKSLQLVMVQQIRFLNSTGGIYLKSSDKMVHPVMAASGRETIPSKTPLFLNILSENTEFKNEFKMEAFAEGKDPMCYPKIPILDVLNLKNGFLDENGAMTIEYGFHFNSIFDQIQKMWKFNLKSKIFDCESKKNMISYKRTKILYSHKQLILFHDTHSEISHKKNIIDIMEIPKTIEMEYFENFLQIAHGVQLKLYGDKLMNVIRIAHRYGIQNVLKYCERQVIMNFEEFCDDESLKIFSENIISNLIFDLIKNAVDFNLNRLLAFLFSHKLKKLKIKNQNFLEKLNLDQMTSESMKMIVANVLYGKY